MQIGSSRVHGDVFMPTEQLSMQRFIPCLHCQLPSVFLFFLQELKFPNVTVRIANVLY